MGSISPGFDSKLSYQVRVGQDVEPGEYINIAEVAAKNHNPVSANVAVEVRSPVVLGQEARPELEVKKTADKDFVNPDSSLVYSLKIANNGEAGAVNVAVVDNLPNGFADIDGSSQLAWAIPSIEAGESWDTSFAAYVGKEVEEGEYENIVKASADNHPEIAQDKVMVEVRKGAVLGEEILPKTGISFFSMLIIFFFSFSFFLGGIIGFKKAFSRA